MNGASVDMVMEKADRELNKNAFDYLYAHKDEVEEKLGASVNWWRFEEGKASYVSYSISDVGTRDESSWTQMAKFHAEWSKKMYDALVPLLEQWNVFMAK
jgi:hypothetical protein